jgi:uncharacterized membrane protein
MRLVGLVDHGLRVRTTMRGGGGVQESVTKLDRGRSMGVCALIGVGLMAAIDEIVFHQLLSWHHFYDRSTTEVALISDGFLHAAELVVLVAGFFLFADLRRRHTLARRSAWAGLFLGLGGFQLFDGVVDHKVLRVHQVRYGVDTLPYDLAWNGGALALLGVGLVLAVRSRGEGGARSVPGA